jgi:hypothetical protein
MPVKTILGARPGPAIDEDPDEYPWKKKHGMGTKLAEYSASGPFYCALCWYLKSIEPRKDAEGLCSEPHMIDDPETKKSKIGKTPYAVVDKWRGCCRFIDPVARGERDKDFVYEGDPEEESEEHGTPDPKESEEKNEQKEDEE